MVLWWIIKYHQLSKKKAKEKAEQEIKKEEEKRGITLTEEEKARYREAEAFHQLVNNLAEESMKLRREVEERLEKVEDPLIKAYIQDLINFEKKSSMSRPIITILYKAISQALDQGLDKDREKFFTYMASTLLHLAHETSKQYPHLNPEYIKEKYGETMRDTFETMTDPTSTLMFYLTGSLKYLDHPDAKTYYKKLEEMRRKIYEALEKINSKNWKDNPGLAYSTFASLIAGTPYEEVLKTPEEILGIKPEEEEEKEEESIAAKIMAEALLERLPTVSYRIASLVHLLQQDKITPQTALTYLETLHSSHTPQGKALYNLIHRLIDHYEQQISSGKTPDPPSKALQEILLKSGIPAWKDPKEVLREAAERRSLGTWIPAKALLGIPLPPSKAAKATLQLIEKLEKLERGEANPEELDTILELATLAKTIPTQPHPEGPNNLKERTLNPQLWKTVVEELLHHFHQEAVQLGREQESKLIEEMAKIVEEELTRIDKNKPYYKTIATLMRKVAQTLQEKGHPWKDAQWAANLAQNILLTLPLHAMEKGEEPRLKALLTEGYNHQEHETTLILLGLHNFYNQLAQAKTKEEKEALLARARDTINTLEAFKGSVERTVESLKGKETRSLLERMTPHEKARFIGEALHRSIKSVSRVIR